MANEVAYKEEPLCGIYMIINQLNGKQYVGQSIDILRRYREHFRITSHGTKELHEDLYKIGKDNATLVILEECDRELLSEREEYYIRFFKPEYNKSLGRGQLGIIASDETRKKISENVKKRWESYDDETKSLIIKRMSDNHLVGYHHSDETKEKIAAKHRGKKRSKESIAHQLATYYEHKENGYVRKSPKSLWVPIICTTTNEEFESVKSAANHFGIYSANISSVLNGTQKTTHGLHFIYKEK